MVFNYAQDLSLIQEILNIAKFTKYMYQEIVL